MSKMLNSKANSNIFGEFLKYKIGNGYIIQPKVVPYTPLTRYVVIFPQI